MIPLTLRLDALDTGESIKVAIERSDYNRFSSGYGSVVCVHKVYIGLCEVSKRTQQNGLVVDFDSRRFNHALERRQSRRGAANKMIAAPRRFPRGRHR